MLNWIVRNRTVWYSTVCKEMTDVSDTQQHLEQLNFVDLCLQIMFI